MELMEAKINKVNPTWSKDLIIRYVIVELAPYFMRDINYFTSTSQKQYEMFKSGYRPTTPNIFCLTLCEQYKRVLDRFDIRSKIIQASNPECSYSVPLFAMIVEGDEGWYYINPLKDLWSNQLNVTPNEYGVIGSNNRDFVMSQFPYLKSLPAEYVAELDQELEIPCNNHMFAPEVIGGKDLAHYRRVRGIESKEPITRTILAKIKDIGEKYLNIGNVPGPIERNLMYKYFFTTVFVKPEKPHIKMYMDPENDYAIRIDVHDGDEVITFTEVRSDDGVYTLTRK